MNRYNLDKYGLDYETVFDPCHNARAAGDIFNECLRRASAKFSPEQAQLAAFSCYYSGNFRRGFINEGRTQTSYVDRIMAVKPTLTADYAAPIMVIPDGKPRPTTKAPPVKENRRMLSDAKISQISGASGPHSVKALRGD